VTKPIAEMTMLRHHGVAYGTYTTRCTDEMLERLPETFFPALFQEEIPKWCEVRAFFLNKRLYSMALFSQARTRTAVDFRHYDRTDPTRVVPYTVPNDVAESISRLMATVMLDTGSLDLVVTPDGQHIFLEVNPVGQFAMVSRPCNYNLEREIADHLIGLSNG
jgi:hypothetical protein